MVMRTRWARCLCLLALGGSSAFAASCEAVLGIHSPPRDIFAPGDGGDGGDAMQRDPGADADRASTLGQGLVVRYEFDDLAAPTALDAAMWQGLARNASLVSTGAGTAAFSDDRQVGTRSLELTAVDAAAGAYATTLTSPGLRDLTPAAVTFAVWVFVGEDRMWQRIFDFGAAGPTPTSYLFLTPSHHPDGGAATTRFAMTRDGLNGEEAIEGTPLDLYTWHHIVVVLPEGVPYTGRLYVDGQLRGANPNMTLHPADLGATEQNFLGRSQFAADPTFVGKLDDFRIYDRALSDSEILSLMSLRS